MFTFCRWNKMSRVAPYPHKTPNNYFMDKNMHVLKNTVHVLLLIRIVLKTFCNCIRSFHFDKVIPFDTCPWIISGSSWVIRWELFIAEIKLHKTVTHAIPMSCWTHFQTFYLTTRPVSSLKWYTTLKMLNMSNGLSILLHLHTSISSWLHLL